ncbi:MAG: hypothetical protein ACRDD7_12920 [Peptostreptococcaceae bacterium]
MAKLYGLGNQIISDMIIRLMTNKDFYKFVYYKEVSDEDILSMPDLDDPITELYNKQVWLHRRPQKVLHEQDVNVFLTLEDFRNVKTKNKLLKTMDFKIGILVHDSCIQTVNGSRDIALLTCVENIIENDSYFKSLGECKVMRVNHLFGLGLEYSGFEIICRIDGING